MKHPPRRFDTTKIFLLPIIKDLIDYKSIGMGKTGPLFTEVELTYALFITFHPEVLKDIRSVIDIIDLKEFIPYPKNRNMVGITKIFEHISPSQSESLQEQIKPILGKYCLSDNWKVPMQIKILTNILPIPYQDCPIAVVDAVDTERNQVFISIDRQVTKESLKDWIDERWNREVYQALKRLPEQKYTKLSASNLALGLVFMTIGGKKIDWSKVGNFITTIEGIDENFFGNGENTPSITDLQKLVSASKNALRSFYPIKSQ